MPVSTSTAVRKVARKFKGGSLQTVRDSTSTGVGTGYDFGANAPANYALMGVGDSTAWRASLQGSADGTNWVNLLTSVGASTAPSPTRSTMSVPYQFLRSIVTAGTTSTAVGVSAYILANAAGVADESTNASDAVNIAQVAGATVKTGYGTSTGATIRTALSYTPVNDTYSTDKSVTSTGAVTLLAGSANRKRLVVQHNSTSGHVRITIGKLSSSTGLAPTAAKGIRLGPLDSYIEEGELIHQGPVKAIRQSTGTAKVAATPSS